MCTFLIYVCTVCMYPQVYVCMYRKSAEVCTYVCTFMYVCMYVCVRYISVYIVGMEECMYVFNRFPIFF